jgi:hypothetical protein
MLARKEQLGCYNYTKGVSDPLVLHDDMLERLAYQTDRELRVRNLS